MTSPASIPAALPDTPARRRPWLAALLTVLATGAGHVYVGAPRRGVALWALDWLLGLTLLAAFVVAPGRWIGLGIVAAAYLASRIWFLALAWRAARKPEGDWVAWPAWQRGLATAASVALAWWVSGLTQRNLKERFIEAFRIPSDAMAPTIVTGDYLFATRVRATAVARDQVVVYRTRDESGALGQQFVKRVAGLPGDTLQMTDGILIRNQRRVPEPYTLPTRDTIATHAPEMLWQRRALLPGTDSARYMPTQRSWGPLVVAADSIFLLGDNRDNSLDARYEGFTALADVVKRPRRIYWSWDPEAGRTRWNRVGMKF